MTKNGSHSMQLIMMLMTDVHAENLIDQEKFIEGTES